MRRFKPDVILGTGGYVAFPTCLAAFISKRAFFLHESNVLPGFVNRALCWYARCVFTAFKIPEAQLKERVCVPAPCCACACLGAAATLPTCNLRKRSSSLPSPVAAHSIVCRIDCILEHIQT